MTDNSPFDEVEDGINPLDRLDPNMDARTLAESLVKDEPVQHWRDKAADLLEALILQRRRELAEHQGLVITANPGV
jgi:type IV secretory pathway TraG/TraD family ATPase VirD4